MIDIVAIKKAVKDGTLSAYVKDGSIYLSNDISETVEIGRIDEGKETRYDKLRRLVTDLLNKGEIDDQIYKTMMDEIARLEENNEP